MSGLLEDWRQSPDLSHCYTPPLGYLSYIQIPPTPPILPIFFYYSFENFFLSCISFLVLWKYIFLSLVRPTEATTLLPSTPERSELPQSAALEPSLVPDE